jgi:hypothetical protein
MIERLILSELKIDVFRITAPSTFKRSETLCRHRKANGSLESITERCRDGRPRHVPMPIHVPIGHGVRDTLMAKLAHQPIENRRSVMAFDGSDEAGLGCITLQVVDARDLPGKIADSPNKGLGVLHSCALARNGDLARHVRSTPPTGAERRCRRRCTAGSSEWIGVRRGSEHRVATRRLYERGGQRG